MVNVSPAVLGDTGVASLQDVRQCGDGGGCCALGSQPDHHSRGVIHVVGFVKTRTAVDGVGALAAHEAFGQGHNVRATDAVCKIGAFNALNPLTHIADVEVDPETGRSKIVRYTVIQDAGKAVHPTYVEGQYQGGAAQGIGWALNEEYIYGKDGRLQNPGFLDYRIPVCSDLPMIDTQILEIPNPNHPYGVRGVGETSIVPPLAAIANAMSNAFGVRMTHVPMSPPRVLKALEAAKKA